jgi:hypothetical protein
MGWVSVFPKIVIGGGWRTISMYLCIYNNVRSHPASAMDMHIICFGQPPDLALLIFPDSSRRNEDDSGELENVDHPACLRRLEGEILGIGGPRFRKEGMSRAMGHSGEEGLI